MEIIEKSKINEKYIFTFKPKHPEKFNNRKRFSVGAWSLWKYIGDDNAIKILNKLINKKIKELEGVKAGYKYSKKYRQNGELIIYGK